MSAANETSVEEIFEFFRNVLNILPTSCQKGTIDSIHNGGIYYPEGRQTGEKTAINGYFIWLLHNARDRGEKITIIMYNKSFTSILFNRDCLQEINCYSRNQLQFNKPNSYDLACEGGRILFSNRLNDLRGIDIDYLYAESDMDVDLRVKKMIASCFVGTRTI